ncbi:hypothetical protein OG21DRAFT_1511228 [Imleria badia]|nr:hypothetical protein OG21DRAFT_1511228 [Imleria badia]
MTKSGQMNTAACLADEFKTLEGDQFYLTALFPLFIASSVRAYPGSARREVVGSDRHINERGMC